MPSTREMLKNAALSSAAALGALGIATLAASPANAAKPDADHAISTKGTGAAGRAAAADHAIQTKGTGTSGRTASKVTFKATATFSDGTSQVLKVAVDSNQDGGVTREGELRVTCAGGKVASALYTDRKSGSVIDTSPGRRAGTFVKTSAVYKGSWDLKSAKGARMAAGVPASTPVLLDSSADELCRS